MTLVKVNTAAQGKGHIGFCAIILHTLEYT